MYTLSHMKLLPVDIFSIFFLIYKVVKKKAKYSVMGEN